VIETENSSLLKDKADVKICAYQMVKVQLRLHLTHLLCSIQCANQHICWWQFPLVCMLNIYAIFMDLIGVIYGFLCGL